MIIAKAKITKGSQSISLVPRCSKYLLREVLTEGNKIPLFQVFSSSGRDGYQLFDLQTGRAIRPIGSYRPLYLELFTPAEEDFEIFLLGESLDD